jgi:hypothetical protein
MVQDYPRKPFAYTLGYSKFIPSGAVSTQLVRMPWQTPVQKPGYVRKVSVTSAWGTAGVLNIWDQDLSNTTPPTAGSAGAAIYSLEIAQSAASGVASKTTLFTTDQLADIPFIGGLACQSSVPGATVDFDIEYI